MIHLIQSREWFGPSERRDELAECWLRNEGLFDDFTHPEGRPTFTELFALCKPDMVNVIANSDIYFDREGVELLKSAVQTSSHCLALSRWDVQPDGTAVLWDHADSQDVWVIYGVPPRMNVPWTMGKPGIDNRLVYELQKAALVVTNPSRTIKVHHLHNCTYRSYAVGPDGQPLPQKLIDRVPPPYALVKPSFLS